MTIFPAPLSNPFQEGLEINNFGRELCSLHNNYEFKFFTDVWE